MMPFRSSFCLHRSQPLRPFHVLPRAQYVPEGRRDFTAPIEMSVVMGQFRITEFFFSLQFY